MRLALSHTGGRPGCWSQKGQLDVHPAQPDLQPQHRASFRVCLVRPGSWAHTQLAQRRGFLQLSLDLPALQEVTGLCSVHSIPPKLSRWPLSPRSWSLMIRSEPQPEGWVASSLFTVRPGLPSQCSQRVSAKERPINKTILDAPGDPGMGLTWPLPPGSPQSRSGGCCGRGQVWHKAGHGQGPTEGPVISGAWAWGCRLGAPVASHPTFPAARSPVRAERKQPLLAPTPGAGSASRLPGPTQHRGLAFREY